MRRVFISSTFHDLETYRDAVLEAVLALNQYHPVMMENFPATNASALEICRREVQSCDILIGVYAYRYGSIPPGQTKSITELEYDWACEARLERLIFVIDQNYAWKYSQEPVGSDSSLKLEAFKQRLGQERVFKKFTTEDSLRAGVLQALAATPPSSPIPIHLLDAILATELAIQWFLYLCASIGWFVGGAGPSICCLTCPYVVCPTSLITLFFGLYYGRGRAKRTLILSGANAASMFVPVFLLYAIPAAFWLLRAVVHIVAPLFGY